MSLTHISVSEPHCFWACGKVEQDGGGNVHRSRKQGEREAGMGTPSYPKA